MIDIVLMKTQRKTPTVIHPGYKITRIRSFYMRKVKFTQQSIDEKFAAMLTEFPKLDDIHPFYADLMNVLYDRDHYKLALGQINTSRNIIGSIARDYLRLLKYGDSLFRCKQLKRAALGRMCTMIKKLKAPLGYLEEIRKHMSRLPALDPNTRTLLLTGYPNVGKSSFMNKVTRAEVDVQPYAFTTKGLYVGHMDHRYLRFQCVDSPGVLDRPIEERNTIEMQAITALAHLQCCVLYFLDISEQCGYPLDQQLKLFESLRPLFSKKQVIIVANKTDVVPYESLPSHIRSQIESIAQQANAEVIPMSNVSEENVSQLKNRACDKLLEARVDAKLSAGRVKDDVMARISVAIPKPRDRVVRDVCIPESVAQMQRQPAGDNPAARLTEKMLMWQNGGPGVYACDYRKYYLLEDDEWKFDPIPEIMDGKNVMDFFDADIEERLRELENEEAELEARGAYAPEEDDEDEIDEEEMLLYDTIKEKQSLAKLESHLKKKDILPKQVQMRHRTEDEIREQLTNVGYDAEGLIEHVRGRKRTRSLSPSNDDSQGQEELMDGTVVRASRSYSQAKKRTATSTSRTRSQSATRGPTTNSVPVVKQKQVKKSVKSMERKIFRYARSGEADREHYPKLVKHMNSGKRSLGTSTIGR
jgi:nucleolar GTP-binding protein